MENLKGSWDRKQAALEDELKNAAEVEKDLKLQMKEQKQEFALKLEEVSDELLHIVGGDSGNFLLDGESP